MTSLLLFVVAVAAAVFVGTRFAPDTWYRRLRKPGWNPPDWVFAPVWTTLYVCITIAGWIAWRDGGDHWSVPLYFWVAQLLMNALWTWMLFRRHLIGGALAVSSLLLVAIGGFIVTAFESSPAASMLFAPYAIWVAFATTLNAAILRLKRDRRRRRPGKVDLR